MRNGHRRTGSGYLEEVPRVVAGSDVFEVFTHLDYAIRHWPTVEAGPIDPSRFEEAIRVAMRAIAQSGHALEMNTRRLQLWMPMWWREEGGRAATFGSDSHVPETVGDGFPGTAALLEQVGFRHRNRPEAFLGRSGIKCPASARMPRSSPRCRKRKLDPVVAAYLIQFGSTDGA